MTHIYITKFIYIYIYALGMSNVLIINNIMCNFISKIYMLKIST